MKKMVLISLLVAAINVSGQNLFPEKMNNCNTNLFFVENDKKLTDYLPKDSLIGDLVKLFSKANLTLIKGEINFQIVIDTMGNPCCVSILNKTNISTEEMGLNTKINAMNKWSIPIHENHKTSISLIIKLEFFKDKIVLQRLGFSYKDRMRKYITLETQTASRILN